MDLMDYDLVEVVDILAMLDGHRLPLLLARRPRPTCCTSFPGPSRSEHHTPRRAEWSSGDRGRERMRKWREAGRQMDWLKVDLENFQTTLLHVCVDFERGDEWIRMSRIWTGQMPVGQHYWREKSQAAWRQT